MIEISQCSGPLVPPPRPGGFAWRYLDLGYASALAWIMFVLVAGITYGLFKTHKRWVHYE